MLRNELKLKEGVRENITEKVTPEQRPNETEGLGNSAN